PCTAQVEGGLFEGGRPWPGQPASLTPPPIPVLRGPRRFSPTHCKLCPMDWLSHRGKCYWFSKDSKNWTESRADCSAKSSRKLVIQDQEEMEFIQNVTRGKYHVWLGLSVTSAEKNWTWVDNSVFPVTGPTDVNSCGVIKGNRIHSETCSAEFKWICQKEAVLL
uniref:C-type lectin domain-containing protein n=1 Tax=Chelonoidis abingdonii TaxID=106734 RepID=A0A8C0QN26_CHEAB